MNSFTTKFRLLGIGGVAILLTMMVFQSRKRAAQHITIVAFLLSLHASAMAQVESFRMEPQSIIGFDFQGNPSLSLSASDRNYQQCRTDVDLLSVVEIQEYLACSEHQVLQIAQLYPPFRLLVGRQLRASEDDKKSWELVKDERENFLTNFENSQRVKLTQLDRYLYFRRWGLSQFLRTFCPEIDDSSIQVLANREREIWQGGWARADNACHDTLTEIGKMVPATQTDEWSRCQTIFTSPLMADISIQIAVGHDEIGDLPDGEEGYRKIIDTKIQFEVRPDGCWERKTYQGAMRHNFSDLLNALQQQQQRDDENDLNITAEQFVELNVKWTDFLKRLNSLTEQKMLGRTLTGLAKIQHNEQKAILEEDWQQTVWDDVLFPFQKEFLIEDAQNRHVMTYGPIGFFSQEALGALPNQPDLKNSAREKLLKLGDDLLQIEQEILQELQVLFDQSKELRGCQLGFQLHDRPKYLPGSMCNLYINHLRFSANNNPKIENGK